MQPNLPFSRLLCVLVLICFCAGASARAETSAPSPALGEGLSLTSGFEEPRVRTAATSSEEDEALLRAVRAYREAAAGDDFRALEAFLANHAQSGWRVAMLTNLGLPYYHYGYFSKTIDALEEAWKEGRAVTEPRAKALVDRAVGELLRMHARLGHAERLAALFDEVGDRGLTGPATEARDGAREGLWSMRNEPGVAYLCGPMALKNLLLALSTPADQLNFRDDYRSGPQGVTLAEVAHLADRAKFSYRLVHRDPGGPIPVPSIVHWKVSHFAAIVGERGGRFEIEDPTFGTTSWVTRAALDIEASGYFLVPGDKPGPAWREVSADEASSVRGMGKAGTNDPKATTPQDDRPNRVATRRAA